MRRRTLLASSRGGGTDPSQAAPLEVAFYNGSSIVIRKQEEWLDRETPIGIVVVPGYHNRYGDGSCGIMSLVGMDCNNPESGVPISSSTQTDGMSSYAMHWGHYGSEVGNGIFLSTRSLNDSAKTSYIPYQANSASTACTGDGEVYGAETRIWPYAGTVEAPTSGASTAYSNTGGYVQATTGKSGCDFNGIRNTAACYVKTRTRAQWTASTVPNSSGTDNTPPAACASRFKTIGTKSFLDIFSGITSNDLSYGTSANTKSNKGFWYLPAEGELCYLPSKKFEINKTILALNQKYGNVGTLLGSAYGYWSSSENTRSSAFYVSMAGVLDYRLKDSYAYGTVRAFLRL